MTLNNPLANVLSTIHNGEKVAHRTVELRNNSKVIRKVLEILQEQEYVQSYEVVDSVTGGLLRVQLAGNINKIGVITPNFSVKYQEYQKWEKRYLPARDFGILVVSTSKGMMTHNQARELGIGGRLIAYCY
ncbi:MAG: 30S ribosomal protein S8 [Candidatus Woesearchaeota archaeon]